MKTFIHGIPFMLLYSILTPAWIYISTTIAWSSMFSLLLLFSWGASSIGSWATVALFYSSVAFMAMVIAFLILLFISGGLNSFLTDRLWFSVEKEWKGMLSHGFHLLIVLLAIHFTLIVLPMLFLPGVATRVISSVIVIFIDGYAAKKIAESWKEEDTQAKRTAEPFFRRLDDLLHAFIFEL